MALDKGERAAIVPARGTKFHMSDARLVPPGTRSPEPTPLR
jgi:hypothetical protein